MSFQSLFALLFFAISYAASIWYKGWNVGIYTLTFGLAMLMMVSIFKMPLKLHKPLAYLIFLITPFLTFIGQIGPLTGFGRDEISLPWQGIAFATTGIAFQLYHGRFRSIDLFGSVLQPLRLLSGPLAISFQPLKKLNWIRFKIYSGWIILGAFFYGVLASGISPLLILSQSVESIDVLFFSIIFEIYVYLNFCGISLIVLGVLNLIGIRTVLNFNAPFSGRNLIGYWQRWHISFGQVLKRLFFLPGRKIFGTSVAVVIVFVMSAMWHGMTLNFVIWGGFHACGWLMTYYLYRVKWENFRKFTEVFLMIFFIIIGRLIFSEEDSNILFEKLSSLISFTWNTNAYTLNMSLDIVSSLTLSACFFMILLEVFLPKKMFRYKLLRQPWVLLIFFGLTVGFGSTGLGSAYGSR